MLLTEVSVIDFQVNYYIVLHKKYDAIYEDDHEFYMHIFKRNPSIKGKMNEVEK